MVARVLNTTYSENNTENKICEYLGDDYPILTDMKGKIFIEVDGEPR